MKCLVTGGAGFIASHLVDRLIKEGNEVVVIDNLSTGRKENINTESKFYEADICEQRIIDIFQKEKPECVFHYAAQISVDQSIKNPIKNSEINIIGSLNVLEASKNSGVKKIFFPSSVGVYGDNTDLPLTEEKDLNPVSNYAFSKLIFEKYLNYYRKDIDFIFFRLANVYGPRQINTGEGGVISIFIDNALSNRPSFIYGDGSQTRDFVYIDDVVDANILLLNSAQKNLYFNVSTNQEIEINSLYQLVYEQSGCNLPPIFKLKREGDIYRSCISYEKINRECGWQPKIDIAEGLKKTVEWIKSSKNAKK